jgi:hypothetical protein
MPSPADLGPILCELYASEIDFSIVSLHNRGWTVTLGDARNGIEAEEMFGPEELEQASSWLIAVVCRRYPESDFARIYGRSR